MFVVKHYKKVIKKPKRWTIKKSLLVVLLLAVVCILALSGAFYYVVLRDLPSPVGLTSTAHSYSTQIFDRHGKLLYTIYTNRNQTFVPLSKIPKQMQEATIAIEDQNFYHESAIDIRGIARAAYSTFFHHQIQGGSTLTQQLVKNSLLTPEQTIQRKIREIVLAFVTGFMYSKNQILEMYLNQVPYGGTSYGIEAAAETYFGKHVNQLSLAEEAFLAGLPQAPSTYSPYGSHPELGKQRQQEVLQEMYKQGYITKNQYDQAISQQLHFQKITNPIKAPHFVFYVKDLLEKKYGAQMVEQGGLKVYTSLDLDIQNYAQATVAAQVVQLKDAYHVTNGAALVTDPATGEILAMVGSTNYFDPNGGSVNITLAHRQPGSSIKPINYAVGLMNGYSAATPFVDEPICFPDPPGPAYCPHNYDLKFHGVVSMRTALGNSINIPAVEMLKLNGIDAMIATASAMGITTFTDPSRYGLSLTLGGGEVTMVDMATAYGVFANGGYRIDLHPILKVTDKNGHVLEQYTPPVSPIFGKKVLPPAVAFIISNILADNTARYLEFGPDSALKIPDQYVSVKTGTTNDFRDNWTIGYTPSYLVAVWVGNNDNTPMSGLASGITGAAPIWHTIMAHLLEGKKEEIPQKPADVVLRYVCGGFDVASASASTNGCSGGHQEYFIAGMKPPKGVGIATEKMWVDKTTGAQPPAGDTTNLELRDETVLTDPLGNKYCLTCAHPTPSPTPTPHP